jgi:hypothetical protein
VQGCGKSTAANVTFLAPNITHTLLLPLLLNQCRHGLTLALVLCSAEVQSSICKVGVYFGRGIFQLPLSRCCCCCCRCCDAAAAVRLFVGRLHHDGVASPDNAAQSSGKVGQGHCLGSNGITWVPAVYYVQRGEVAVQYVNAGAP